MTTDTITADRYQVGLQHLTPGRPVDVFEITGTTPAEVRDAIEAELARLGLIDPNTATVTVFRPDDYDTGICVIVHNGKTAIMRGAGEMIP